MSDLTRFVYYACGSINYDTKSIDDLPTLISHLIDFAESYNRISKYYFIGHTETETLHIHYILYLSSQTQLMTLFNKMRKCILEKYHDIRAVEGINIKKCDNINAHMRYIIHCDSESKRLGKKPYDIDDIVSNDDIDIIESIIKSVRGEIDAYYLRDCVLDTSSEFELMNRLGLKIYHKYRYEIQTLKENRISLAHERDKERNERLQNDFIDNCIDCAE